MAGMRKRCLKVEVHCLLVADLSFFFLKICKKSVYPCITNVFHLGTIINFHCA
jgi:hypothetical protein